jgi:beta-ureidopropionase
LRLAGVQTGPVDRHDPVATLAAAREVVAGADPKPDLVVLPELFALPFWCLGFADPEFFAWAEGLDGPTVGFAADVARSLGAVLVVPFFEKGSVEGEYYNSVAVVDPDGRLVEGTLPSGRRVATYRKNAVSSYRWDDQTNDEKFYFRPGPGYPVFRTAVGTVGVLVCYDRWFPEAWRVLALQGAEIVCVPNASQGDVGELFVPSMRTCAAQQLVHVVAVNRAGTESVRGHDVRYYGRSCIVDPRGAVLAHAGDAPGVIATDVDPSAVALARLRQTMYRDRRPELYGSLCEDPPR